MAVDPPKRESRRLFTAGTVAPNSSVPSDGVEGEVGVRKLLVRRTEVVETGAGTSRDPRRGVGGGSANVTELAEGAGGSYTAMVTGLGNLEGPASFSGVVTMGGNGLSGREGRSFSM